MIAGSVVTITAVSQVDSAATSTATVTLTVPNQAELSAPISLGSSGSSEAAVCTTPAPGFCFGGTLGSLLKVGGTTSILSNNHVLGLSDGTGAVGASVTEPGIIDSPNPCTTTGTTVVGTVSKVIQLGTPTPPVDVTIATANSSISSTDNILELGATCNKGGSCASGGLPDPAPPVAGGGQAATVNESVAKSGRSTGLTCASVIGTDVSVEVTYTIGCTSTSQTVTYTDAVDIGEMSNGDSFSAEGDSGSMMVDQGTATPVALLFAGGVDSNGETDTVGNPVADVLSALGSGTTFIGSTAHAVAGCSPSFPQAGLHTTLEPQTSRAPIVAASRIPVAADVMANAAGVRDRHTAELMKNASVAAVGVGQSLDSPREAAVVVFIERGQARPEMAATLEGVRTRVVELPSVGMRGSLSAEQSAQLLAQATVSTAPLEATVVASATAIKKQEAAALMSDPSVKGVGVSASLDSPGDAALLIFVLANHAHPPIPATIDGLRTRIRETYGFHAGDHLPSAKGCRVSAAAKQASGATKP